MLRHEDFSTTHGALCSVRHGVDARGTFLEQPMENKIYLLTERVRREFWVASWLEDFVSAPLSLLE